MPSEADMGHGSQMLLGVAHSFGSDQRKVLI
jgi:hypothetical protein